MEQLLLKEDWIAEVKIAKKSVDLTEDNELFEEEEEEEEILVDVLGSTKPFTLLQG